MLHVPAPLVSVDWLHEHLAVENLLILDATIKKVGSISKEIKEKEQIQGAIFFDLKNVFSDQSAPYPNTILHPKEFQEKAQALGVDKNSCIVVYDDIGIYSSARVWWLFKTFGFTNIAVLDGGLPEWMRHNYPTEKPVKRKHTKGNFTVHYISKNVSFTKDVLESLHASNKLVIDARSAARFNAKEPEPRQEVRGGHIPSSLNIPFTLLQEKGKMKSPVALKKVFDTINIEDSELIFSCGSGITACVLALGATLSGYENYSVYDGSWTEWGSRHELPIEQINMENHWTKKEFSVYVLLYAAQSNFIETEEERNYILSKIDEKLYNSVHTEIVHDSDYERLKKIKEYLKYNEYSIEDKKELLHTVKEVFFADNSVDFLEKNVFLSLKKILD